MGSCARFVRRACMAPRSLVRKFIVTPIVKRCFGSCGRDFALAKNCDFRGIENIHIGNNVSFGSGNLIMTTRAKVVIGDDVMFGPNVTLVSGDHRTDIKGRPMKSVTDDEKRPEDDQDIVIGSDVWLGGGCTVLKGVHIAQGCVIAADALVVKDTEPYGIYGGVPAKRIAERFKEDSR